MKLLLGCPPGQIAIFVLFLTLKLYAELTDDIFGYYSVPKNSLLKHKTSLSEPLSEAIKPTIVAICNGFSDVLHFATGVALQCGDLHAIYFRGSHR